MAFAREIFQQIKNHIRFQQAEKEKDSHYTILGSTLVRISNHCTHMKVWENYFEKNPQYEGMKIVSIVFEDEGSTFTKQCLQLVNRRDNPIVVGEYVYHSASLSKLEIKSIIKSLQEMDYSNTYKDATKKCLFYPRLSVNPPPPYKVPDKIAQHIGNDLFNKLRNYREWNGIINENKQYKNMNKKNTIRLTESELKKVITESVKRVLKEDNFFNQVDSSRQTGNAKEVMEIYKFLTDVKNKIHFLHWSKNRINGDIQEKLSDAANTIQKYLTDDVINAIINGLRAGGKSVYGGDKKQPVDLTKPFKQRHPYHFDDYEYDEPEDWYERVEHGDFDEEY